MLSRARMYEPLRSRHTQPKPFPFISVAPATGRQQRNEASELSRFMRSVDATFPPPPASRNNGGKMHKMLKSAFKRGDSASSSGDHEPELSGSESGSSTSGSRASSSRRVGRGLRADEFGDRSSRETIELDGEKRNHLSDPFPRAFALLCFVPSNLKVK